MKASGLKNDRSPYGDYDNDDPFNDILNSSPKKKPGQSTIKKEREWEQLQQSVNKNRNGVGGAGMNGFDELLEDDSSKNRNDLNVELSYGGQSPALVNKDLSRELMKERKASVLNQGISLIPTSTYGGGDYNKGTQRTGASTMDLHPTETTKINGRSKLDIEESYPTQDMYNDDDDEFDKLIGRVM